MADPNPNTGARARNILRRVQGPVVVPGPVEPLPEPPVPPAVIESKPPVAPEPPPAAPPTAQPDPFAVEVVEPEAPPVKAEAPKAEVVTQKGAPEPEDAEIDALVSPNAKYGDNLKKVRSFAKIKAREAKELAEKVQKAERELEEYRTGLLIPEVTQAQAQRIEQLEKFEALYNVETSPAYRAKIVEPFTKNKERLNALAEEYQIDPAVLSQAFESEPKVRDQLLLEAFGPNSLAAVEAKEVIKSLQSLDVEARNLKKEPGTALQRLQEENDRIQAEARQKAVENIAFVSKDGWIEASKILRADGRFTDIQHVEGDSEHNEKFVRPLMTKAGQEYAKTIRMLAENGLQSLPKELAIKLATSDQLAIYSAALKAKNDALLAELTELQKLVKTKAHINRPGLNTTSGGSMHQVPSRSQSEGPEATGRRVLDRVLSGRR